ncbi:type II toxin-antitoxin system VapC family toxin [Marinospirillum sp.]|uniref:type II toxin-antitoxin system VapC family toxin n=1 Tax=Marinospirillum sp. TaxID=2183934 RepID=UPI00384CEF98
MNGNRYLLDTNIFINAIHQKIKLPIAHYAFSVITELELLGFPGLNSTDEAVIKAILQQLTRIELNEQIRAETIQIRRSSLMKLPDSIISASAIVTGATLVTDDIKLAQKHNSSVISLDDLLSLS